MTTSFIDYFVHFNQNNQRYQNLLYFNGTASMVFSAGSVVESHQNPGHCAANNSDNAAPWRQSHNHWFCG
jgi:hypothetical protein